MAINSTTGLDIPAPRPTFPCLRRSKTDGSVVLFTDEHKGFVLYQGRGNRPVGYHGENWITVDDTSRWEKCSITLTSAD